MQAADRSGPPGPLLALVGPTASGKTEAAIGIAERLGAEVVSVDSMLVYRGMDLGTAKPTLSERTRVPHHAIDLVEPGEAFSVARYQSAALSALADVSSRGRHVLLAGGSGLYFRAVVDRLEFPGTDPATRVELEVEAEVMGVDLLYSRLGELDPVAAGRIEPGNVRRTVRALEVAAITGRPFSSYAQDWERYPQDRVRAAGIAIDRSVLDRRIQRRVDRMLELGFLDEVRGLLERGLDGWLNASQAIGYAEMSRHLAGDTSLEAAVGETVKRTRSLARRQVAWFRRDPRIRWFDADEGGAASILDDMMEYLRP